ncbi:sister chromatid cohesion protein PDS5 [Entomortierella parvispora]|uniref:Sister chromatid cohesion protein PDS5 n=1 Tax=Entomortierella parvispora TaxID=205924 RepID=A0A9P3HC79_9FUNG|nr:sister chromatid cohesion protein PDS5 [Entomortierella parvispora]
MVKPQLVELNFRQKLTGSAAELLRKLKELQGELKSLEQEGVDTSSITPIAKQLIDSTVVNHKDRGVRIYAACCIADILRLYAPEAPYTEKNLKIIFKFFTIELAHISDPKGTYFSMYYYLLESLSAVRSIALITYLKNADEIMIDLVKSMFDAVRPEQEKNVQICISELLRCIVEEAEALPQDIVDTILAQFLHREKFSNPAAYRLACDLGTQCTEKLQRYVCQYFSDILSTADGREFKRKELEDFRTVHKLVVEINSASPALLLNVIPQLEEELKLADVTIRSLATQSLGIMFAEKSSQLPTQYESTWKAWLQRRNDKVPQVRLIWVESLVDLIKTHGTLAKELREGLEQKIVDPDERIRAATCKVIGEFDYETSLHHIQKSTLTQVGHRCRDKKKSVSKEAINALSVLYSQAYPEIENGTQASISQFGWMPSAILHAVYVNDVEVFTYVDSAVFSTLFPPHGSATSRTRRLVTAFAALDDKGRTGLLSVLKRSIETRSAMAVFLRLLQQQQESISSNPEGAEEIDNKIGSIIKIISDRLPEPAKCSLLLHKYVKFHDEQLFKSISDCMDSSLSVKEIRKAGKDTLSRIESIAPPALEVFTILIQRISLTIANSEILSELINNVADSEEYRGVSGELLRVISTVIPDIFKTNLVRITSLLHDKEFAGASDSLHTLAEFAKQFPNSVPADAKAKSTLQSFLERGSVVQASHATIVLASIPDNEKMCMAIVQAISDRLDVTSERLLIDLTILSKMAQYCPQAFEACSSEVVSFIIKKLITTNISSQKDMYPPEYDWVEKNDLDQYTLSKIMGLKVLVNRAIALLSRNPELAQEAARPVFKLLWTIITHKGEVAQEQNTNAVLKGYLRLNAARFILKLTRDRPEYEKMVSVHEYVQLALCSQDPIYRVRQGITSRIMKYIHAKGLHVRYLAVLILAAHEPELEGRTEIRRFLTNLSRSQEIADNKLMMNELTIARVLHLLANHPDFAPRGARDDNVFSDDTDDHTLDDINLATRYIEYYLEAMANAENVSLIFYIVSMLKTVKFASPNERTRNLYILSDLAQYLIQEKCRPHNWILASYPGQVRLPRELFTPLGQSETSVEISKKNYLSQEWVRAREHKTERRPKQLAAPAPLEKKMGQASKRRSRSPSSSGEGHEDGQVDSDGEQSDSAGRGRGNKGVKRSKKAKTTERPPVEPTRRMASRAAKAKTVYAETNVGESGEDSS